MGTVAGLLPDIRQVDVRGRVVLVRADLNVPMVHGLVSDSRRIAHFAPTAAELAIRGARVVVMTHLGRPSPEHNPVYSTRPLADALSGFLDRKIRFISHCIGASAEAATGDLRDGEVALLENLRFHPGEIENSRNFAMRLSVLGDLYVNDAFSAAHRAHASTHAIVPLMPSYAGPHLQSEFQAWARDAGASQGHLPAIEILITAQRQIEKV